MSQQFSIEKFSFKPIPVRIIGTEGLMTPKAFKNADGTMGSPEFRLRCLVPQSHPQLAELNAIIIRLAQQAFPARVDQNGQWTHYGLNLPLKSGEQAIAEAAAKAQAANRKAPEMDYMQGQLLLSTHTGEKKRDGTMKDPPLLAVKQGGEFKRYEGQFRPAAREFFYNGVYASVEVSLKAYAGGSGGVTCYLNSVLSLGVGDRINMGRSLEDSFGSADSYDEFIGHVSAESVVPQYQPQAPVYQPQPQAPVYAPQAAPVYQPQPQPHPYAPGGVGAPPGFPQQAW